MATGDTIGPVFSDFGLKNWDLCLAREAVIAYPRSLWLTVKAILAGLGHPMTMSGKAGRPSGERILEDAGDSRWRRYPLGELESITLKQCIGSANEVRIKRPGREPHTYGLTDRGRTDQCRTVLRRLYPGLYREENF